MADITMLQRPSRDLRCTHMELLSDMIKAYEEFVSDMGTAYFAMRRAHDALIESKPKLVIALQHLAEAIKEYEHAKTICHEGFVYEFEADERELLAGRGRFSIFASVLNDEELQEYLSDARAQAGMRHHGAGHRHSVSSAEATK